MPRNHSPKDRGRPVVYCLVPRELAGKLHERLRKHFVDDPSVEVIVERRARDRRSSRDRRRDGGGGPPLERRLIRSATGRRVGERRARLEPVEAPPLPRQLRAYRERLAFVERVEPPSTQLEDIDTARVVTRFQAGDRDAFSTLYLRYFERIYTYLRVAIRDPHEAEDLTQDVFAKVLHALPRYELRGQPFRAWLFTIVRHHGIEQLRKRAPLQVMDPAELRADVDEREERADPELIGWITDRDLVMFVERLPESQRQVLVLRYMLGLTTSEIAAVLERSESNVRMLHSRALRLLRERLSAVGRAPTRRGHRPGMRRRVAQASVLRERRFALVSPWTGSGPRGRNRAG